MARAQATPDSGIATEGFTLLPAPYHVERAEPSQHPRLSVVVPAMNEEGNLEALCSTLAGVLDREGIDFEILIVDDGSTDGTWHVAKGLSARDPRVAALRHRRNFGKARGLATGFAAARGDLILTMDADLQDDPAEIPRFLAKLDEGFDLVSGWKQRRQDPLGKTLPSRLFNATVRIVSGVPLHDFNCGFKLYRADVVRNIRLYGELHRFTPVLAHAEGFRVGELAVRHHPRRWGTSKYGWSRLVKGFLDLLTVTFLTEYRQRPMHVLGVPGACGARRRRAHRSLADRGEDAHRGVDRQPAVTPPRGAPRARRRAVLRTGSAWASSSSTAHRHRTPPRARLRCARRLA